MRDNLAMTDRDDRQARFLEIEESIKFMQQRLDQGQGNVTMAMCRLSLSMSNDLLAMAEANERDRESLSLARALIGQHLIDNGPCDDAPDYEDGEYEPCDDEHCSYCALCVSEFGHD